MSDIFANMNAGLESPPSHAFNINPSDTTDLNIATRGIMVGVAGDVALITISGDEIILPALSAGIQYAIRAARIKQTGTTATNIIGLA